jgi:hypothetical protein
VHLEVKRIPITSPQGTSHENCSSNLLFGGSGKKKSNSSLYPIGLVLELWPCGRVNVPRARARGRVSVITTRQEISFPRRCQTSRLLPAMSALRTVRQLTKLRPALRAARPTVGVARARGFAVSAPALKSGTKPASSSGTSSPLPCRQIFPSEFSPAATTLLAQKLRAEISYEAEVQQDDVQVGAVPQDLVEFLQEGGWEVRPAHIPFAWADGTTDQRHAGERRGIPHAPFRGREVRCAVLASFPVNNKYRIRVMFSIADLQSIPDEDEPEPEATDDGGPARGDEPALRVSVAITKVCLRPCASHSFHRLSLSSRQIC